LLDSRIFEITQFYYASEARMGSTKNAEWNLAQLRKIMERAWNQNPHCFQSIVASYLVASVSVTRYSGPSTAVNAHAIEDRAALLAAYLFREGHIEFLTPDSRKKKGTAWQRYNSKRKSHEILGAYDCSRRRISIDPSLPPGNLSAVWFHELDHFLRDRFALENQSLVPSKSEDHYQLDLRSYLLLDETLAITTAGIRQRLARYGESTPDGLWEIGSDMNLYQRKGPLERLWKDATVPMGYPEFGAYRFDLLELLRNSFMGLTQSSRRNARKIFEIVEAGYFRDHTQSAKNLSEYPPAQLLELAPIAVWTPPESHEARELRRFFPVLNAIKRSLPEISAACRSFQAALKRKDPSIAGYLGAITGTDRPGNEGVRPGNEGVRPDELTVRPCLLPSEKL
jgi:hypothetical protein